MASLSASLHIAMQGLNAAAGAIQVTNNNIANVNTAGYTRETAVISGAQDTQVGEYSLGNGVQFEGYKSVRSELLQGQIRSETSDQSQADAALSTLQTLETSFTTSSSTSNIGNEITDLFSSISDLSSNPTSSSLRQSVLTSAQNLATAFNNVSSTLSTLQNGLNSQVSDDVGQINSLSEQIAKLNPQIEQKESAGDDAGTLQDQQDELILKLAALTNVNVTSSSSGVTITTGGGTALVAGQNSYDLSVGSSSSTSMGCVLDSNGDDITDTLTSGDLGGTLTTRDQTLTNVQTQLDTLAYDLGSAFNTAQASGYDENGEAGSDLFTIPSSSSGAAAAITVALSDPDAIAASSDTSTGGSGNVSNFQAIQTTKLSSGMTPSDAYSSLVYQVGSYTSSADAESSAASSTLTQLNDQLQSVSGVSIDEEAANLIQYQQAYSAAAHVVTTVQSLFTTLMDAVS